MYEPIEMNSRRDARRSYQSMGDLGDPSSYGHDQQQQPLYNPPLDPNTPQHEQQQPLYSPPLHHSAGGYTEPFPVYSPPLDNGTPGFDYNRTTWGSQSTWQNPSQTAWNNSSTEKLTRSPGSDGSGSFRAEKSKAVLQKGFGLLSYWIHVVSVGCTAALLVLNFTEIYLSDDNDWDSHKWSLGLNEVEISNILQFVVKVHEILIVGSMSAMIFTVIRRRLIGRRGVPFGFLMGGYQLSSAEYLFSGGFWGPVTYAWRHRRKGLIGLSMVIGCTVVYANVVGPSVAVLMIPNLRWYNVNDPFNGRALTSYISSTHDDIYPVVLRGEDYLYSYDCYTANISTTCPGSGNADLVELAAAYAREGINASLSIAQPYGRARRQLSANVTKPDGDTVLIASTLHADVTELVGLFWHYVSSNRKSGLIFDIGRPKLDAKASSDIFTPVVQVQCSAFDYDKARNGEVDVTFPTRLLKTSFNKAEGGMGPPVDPLYWDDDREYNSTYFTWVDLRTIEQDGQSYSASLGALATVPYWSGPEDDPVQESLLIPCVLDARWAATEIHFDPTSTDVVVSNASDFTQFAGETDETVLSKYGLGGSIAIDHMWAEMLNFPDTVAFGKNWTQVDCSAIEALFWPFIEVFEEYWFEGPRRFKFDPPASDSSANYSEMVSETVATVLSLALADGLSRVSYDFVTYLTVVDSVRDNFTMVNLFQQVGNNSDKTSSQPKKLAEEDYVKIEFQVQRYGWGYSTRSKTAKFAVAMLLIHSAIAVFYVFYGVYHWVKSRWSSSSWGDVSEIVALAMLSSPPTSLEGAGAGIDKWDTWKLDCRIRERGSDQLELLVGHGDVDAAVHEEDLVKRGKKYK